MLRRLLVPVMYNPQFLFQNNTPLDVSVLRAAHHALVRHQSGTTDAFLFIFCGEMGLEEAKAAIAPYGFPDVDVICISTKDDRGDEIADEEVRGAIGDSIARWLRVHHPAAITDLSCGQYSSLDMWWTGVEATENEWDFLDVYANTLPEAHQKKAGTWLAIIAEMHDLQVPCWANTCQLALFAAALCEWLHGFEAVSGNNSNGFDVDEVSAALQVDDMFIGVLLGQSASKETFDEILFNAEVDDLDGLKSYALKEAIRNERSTIRDTLSEYFGADSALFWALHTAIWPQYHEPSADLCNSRLNSSSYDDLAANSDPWMFVADGWSDAADT